MHCASVCYSTRSLATGTAKQQQRVQPGFAPFDRPVQVRASGAAGAADAPLDRQGVEVVTGSHTPAEYLKYADMAQEFGLLASRGSDFHDPAESHTDLGTLPALPKQLNPVWEALEHRIHRP